MPVLIHCAIFTGSKAGCLAAKAKTRRFGASPISCTKLLSYFGLASPRELVMMSSFIGMIASVVSPPLEVMRELAL